MKKLIITGVLFLFAVTAKAQTFPFYDADGTLKSNRTVTMNGNFLRFLSTSGGGFFQNGVNGRIGVNTTSPLSELDVRGQLQLNVPTSLTTHAPTNASILSNGGMYITNSQHPIIRLKLDGLNKFLDIALAGSDYYYSNNALAGDVVMRAYTPGSYIITNEGGGGIKIATRNNANPTTEVRMVVTELGNVGIGTETPDAKLAVNGLIHTKEVKVDLVGWPDYVFENEYKLPTIQEVENYINENGHLPNVPSARELEESGLELGEMTKIQQEKIEELTLYLIQQQKENQELKKELDELKAIVQTLVKDKQ